MAVAINAQSISMYLQEHADKTKDIAEVSAHHKNLVKYCDEQTRQCQLG